MADAQSLDQQSTIDRLISSHGIDTEIGRWLSADPDPVTKQELLDIVSSDLAAARQLFADRIGFGTAGLRAALGPGPTQMNRLVVRQTTLGLLHWLTEQNAGRSDVVTVVVGFDGRHRSLDFANEVVDTVTDFGARAVIFPRPCPTPVLALSVLDQGASAGVMITASHNPATDNGYKLYLDDGIQLSAPADIEISNSIDEVVVDMCDASLEPSVEGEPPIVLDDDPFEAHERAVVGLLTTEHRSIKMLYTPLHGVGGEQALRCFAAAGFPTPDIVDEQFEPDPDFPTTPYPNPESPEVLNPALAAAAAIDADPSSQGPSGGPLDLILANDPDADRLAVVTRRRPDSQWITLSGNMIGALLADHIIRHADLNGSTALLASSIVSSRFVSTLAADHGVESFRTLTGFKWLARPIVDRPDSRYLLGFEEALGFCVGGVVRDKDGIGAALVMAEAAAEQRAAGRTLLDQLDDLMERYGLHLTDQLIVDLSALDMAASEQFKAKAMLLRPSELDGIEVSSIEDLALGQNLPPASGIVIDLVDGSRVIIRPSGTEPKLKAYFEVIGAPGEPIDGAQEVGQQKIDRLKRAVDLLLN